jgi:hypothetical protein
MCKPVSGLINADHTIHLLDPSVWEHSHSKLASKVGIPDGLIGDKWARWELSPKEDDFRKPVAEWVLHLDEDRAPKWWGDNLPEIDDKIRRAVERYMDAARANGVAPFSAIASTGDRAASSSTGDCAASSSTGYCAASSSTGNCAASSSTGYCAASSSTGNCAASSSTGNCAASSSTGYCAASSSTGNESAAVATGYGSAVRGAKGCALLAAERDENYKLIAWAFGVVDGKAIKPDVWYEAKKGKLKACSKERVAEIESVIAKAGSEAVKPEACGPQAK